jgi:site-specific DNA-methyltransferase (adenine-specific)
VTIRRRPGEIRDAIIGYLAQRRKTASVTEIYEAVQRAFGDHISPSSVRSYLRLNSDDLFVRERRGHYSLFASRPRQELQEWEPVFTYGRASLYQGDCLAWLKARAEQSIHAVVTDPPYGLVEYTQKEQEKLRNGHGGVWRIPPSFDGHRRSPLPRFTTLTPHDVRQLDYFFQEWAAALFPVLVPGAHVLIASNALLSFIVAGAVARAGFERRGEIVRLVMTMRGGDRPKNAHIEFAEVSVMPRSMWEPWLVFRKPLEGRVQDNLRRWRTGGFRRLSAERPFGDVIRSHPTRSSERRLAAHPSLKPQSFLRQIVRAVLPLSEGTVLDPFAGSGSTLAAAQAVGYEAVGVEIDPHYVEMAKTAIPALAQLRM